MPSSFRRMHFYDSKARMEKNDQPAPKGTVKFNVRMKQWNWCNNDCRCRQVSGTHH